MEDRLEIALSFVEDELDPKYRKFLIAIKDIIENVDYYDFNDFEEWVDDDSDQGCEAYVRQVLNEFL